MLLGNVTTVKFDSDLRHSHTVSLVATAVEKVENELSADELISRRNNISLQDMTTTAAAVRDAGEEDVTMKAVLL
ncbi:hypothetical protein BDBG_16142 [Blastomyces gilchristii SLH14081]|uniref:Uncharacterized protein n=1 Tax=Blastomyces gilchristii (strain SLH14081) TaxID=559298 RepID=A0A179UAA9_BLAGS|nr:uncharacterized protein BDBG_16142 [Blastomyces gilchristii SLH14081]OAT03921.1 hypothetical protein BDBG_16142 [Blastomyces gilchristii SLH14081]